MTSSEWRSRAGDVFGADIAGMLAALSVTEKGFSKKRMSMSIGEGMDFEPISTIRHRFYTTETPIEAWPMLRHWCRYHFSFGAQRQAIAPELTCPICSFLNKKAEKVNWQRDGF